MGRFLDPMRAVDDEPAGPGTAPRTARLMSREHPPPQAHKPSPPHTPPHPIHHERPRAILEASLLLGGGTNTGGEVAPQCRAPAQPASSQDRRRGFGLETLTGAPRRGSIPYDDASR